MCALIFVCAFCGACSAASELIGKTCNCPTVGKVGSYFFGAIVVIALLTWIVSPGIL